MAIDNELRLLAQQQSELKGKWQEITTRLWNAVPTEFCQLTRICWFRELRDFTAWLQSLSVQKSLYFLIEARNITTYGFANFLALRQALSAWQAAWPLIEISLDTSRAEIACLQFTLRN